MGYITSAVVVIHNYMNLMNELNNEGSNHLRQFVKGYCVVIFYFLFFALDFLLLFG